MQTLDLASSSSGVHLIRKETVLPAGSHEVSAEIVILPGAKLVIEPETALHFAAGIGLTVMGTLQAVGSVDKKITFEGQSWPGVTFIGSEIKDSHIAHASITRARGRAWAGEFSQHGIPVYGMASTDTNVVGAAIQIHGSSTCLILLTDMLFKGNGFNADGGAVFVKQSTVEFNRCSFESNFAGNGGALHLVNSSAVLESCTFAENGSEGATGTGGAIFASDSSGHIGLCKFNRNASYDGAAIVCHNSTPSIRSCTFNENSAINNGGAIKCTGTSMPQILRCSFAGNKAGACGGAIHVTIDGRRPLQMSRSTFEDNTSGQEGGALFCDADSHAQLSGCRFLRNCVQKKAHSGGGGAIYCEKGSHLNIDSSGFEDNQAVRGGAIAFSNAESVTSAGTTLVTLKDAFFKRNLASAMGGALCVSQDSSLDISANCAFLDNEALQAGGAISSGKGSKVLVCATEFHRNKAPSGGAVDLRGQRSRLDACIFKDNEAGRTGGAIACHSTMHVHACQFERNVALEIGGGAIWCIDTTTIIDTCSFTKNRSDGSLVGGAIRCQDTDGKYQTSNTFSKNVPNNVSYQKTSYPTPVGLKYKRIFEDCWIVTAYYGSPHHPRVTAIRGLRDRLLVSRFAGPPMTLIDSLYRSVGKTTMGQWWISKLEEPGSQLPRAVTRPLCDVLYRVSGTSRQAPSRGHVRARDARGFTCDRDAASFPKPPSASGRCETT
ncbi:MAG: hypothetical protein KAY24_00875 [Candidatus Eisenbacteria sp.]|nr:hypothetical protein [Candidatus Eisenbacteria bacterium]